MTSTRWLLRDILAGPDAEPNVATSKPGTESEIPAIVDYLAAQFFHSLTKRKH